MQRYRCLRCLKVFQSPRRKSGALKALWNDYVWGKQTLTQLAGQHDRSVEWVRNQLERVGVEKKEIIPQPIVVIPDTTFWGRLYGVTVFRAAALKRNIWWTEVKSETQAVYHYGRKILEEQGWTFLAAVVDGRRGLATVFKDISVQICQFHQMKTVTKYLTRRPKTEAGQELRAITLKLPKSNEKEFTALLRDWHKRWNSFIIEKTYVLGTKHWYYTHKNVRSAYKSLERNLPFLFTYQKYPELNIPNTTNSLDGFFSQLKARLSVHRGLRKDRRFKVISEILGGE
jgi:hypothetical protein